MRSPYKAHSRASNAIHHLLYILTALHLATDVAAGSHVMDLTPPNLPVTHCLATHVMGNTLVLCTCMCKSSLHQDSLRLAGNDLVPAHTVAEASVRFDAGGGRFWTPGLTVSKGAHGTSVGLLVRGELFCA